MDHPSIHWEKIKFILTCQKQTKKKKKKEKKTTISK